MLAIPKRNKVFFLILISIFLISCDENTEFNQYKSLENSSWKANENIVFDFMVKDTIQPKNLFINIRNNNKFEFSNLYIITNLKFPNGTEVIDTLQYQMADASGRFLGNGFTEIKDNKLFYKEHKIFPFSGDYQLSIKQAMRKNGEVNPIPFLKGITDVGLSIEKISK
ncbi:gliding motility lipoprotein GldH [Polaribacter aestuariivivens]|uniref:Gliding motility lipoprotein GldH n=1 Tax=Polaribacter aestuariivivens TaxID=2304626 RepID=A0A5S3N5C2_9FLAO|nr:gliding motility lipoprotein GldH [Polaribacter aestuariivivens]TMM30561.1 gliding motility lipoprotein GldH [Polaribacter aestuariivivens]